MAAEQVDHNVEAERYEHATNTSLDWANNQAQDTPEARAGFAEAQALANLAVSHRIAALTEALDRMGGHTVDALVELGKR